jgi:type III pantothenate kinase
VILLLDIGNTRLKWAWLEDGRAGPARAVQHHGAATAWQAELEEWHAALEAEGRSPERILASNVAGGAFARTLGGWSKARFGFWPEFVTATASACGVTSAYASPAALGVDRWLGLIAARDAGEGSACIVNAGTAVTIDALDAGGRQLGGFILPGLKLMTDALYSRTQNVAPAAAAEPPAARGFFAVNTAGAVELGPLLAVASLADRAVTELMRAGGAEPRLLLTGGDAERVQRHLLRPASLVPDLVIAGLAVLARQPSP